jgi:AraC-like DNA-binding protein
MDVKIIRLKKKMLANLRHQWTINEMSKMVEITPAHLQRIFKTATGMPPMNYLRNLRLEKAKELLQTSLKYVNEICYEVGINDQSHFTRNFKKKYGVTPTEYRQQHYEKLEAEGADG